MIIGKLTPDRISDHFAVEKLVSLETTGSSRYGLMQTFWTPHVTARYPRQAPIQPPRQRFGTIAGWFAHLSIAIIVLGIGHRAFSLQEDYVERLQLSDGAYTGTPEVYSANLIRFENVPVRLAGIDAPDLDQMCVTMSEIEWRCGQAAADILAELVANAPVTCEGQADDSGTMILATCHNASAENINAWLVEYGWAVADRNGSLDYTELEDSARQAHRGIWASRFELPKDWRIRKQGTD